ARDTNGNTANATGSNGSGGGGDRNNSSFSTIRMDAASDTGQDTNDGITNDTTPSFSGAVPVGATVQIKIYNAQGQVVATVTPTVQPDGSYSFTVPQGLPDGTYSPQIITTQNGVATTTPGDPFTIDTRTNVDITQAGLAGTTNAISGTGEPGAVVTVRDANNNIVGSATVGANGTWSLTPTSAVVGDTITASARDAAGNTATTSDPNKANTNGNDG
ncbi:Ig-like domain-containing protein, partial [Limnohabitans sp. 2KL-51]|uniref:Ig-like domain-containing protein n=1 Tax=Limnohabitans sp. 2KL-51 TaxID=1977911 RepID=UPI000DD21D5E